MFFLSILKKLNFRPLFGFVLVYFLKYIFCFKGTKLEKGMKLE